MAKKQAIACTRTLMYVLQAKYTCQLGTETACVAIFPRRLGSLTVRLEKVGGLEETKRLLVHLAIEDGRISSIHDVRANYILESSVHRLAFMRDVLLENTCAASNHARSADNIGLREAEAAGGITNEPVRIIVIRGTGPVAIECAHGCT